MPAPVPEKPRGSLLVMGLVGAVAIVSLVGLMFLTLGYFVLVLVIGGGVFGLAALHYVVWGWWLAGVIRAEEAAAARRAEQERDLP